MATEKKSEYTTEDMLTDFANPIVKITASELATKGELEITAIREVISDKYGSSYVGTFEDTDGMVYESFIQAKQPYTVFDTYRDALIGSCVKFSVINTKTGNTILKCHLIKSTPALDDLMA